MNPPAYLTIVYRITHPAQPRALLEQAEWSAASHTHAIHERDQLHAQRDELILACSQLLNETGRYGRTPGAKLARAAIAKAEDKA